MKGRSQSQGKGVLDPEARPSEETGMKNKLSHRLDNKRFNENEK